MRISNARERRSYWQGVSFDALAQARADSHIRARLRLHSSCVMYAFSDTARRSARSEGLAVVTKSHARPLGRAFATAVLQAGLAARDLIPFDLIARPLR